MRSGWRVSNWIWRAPLSPAPTVCRPAARSSCFRCVRRSRHACSGCCTKAKARWRPGSRCSKSAIPTSLEVEVEVLSTHAVKIAPGSKVILDRWGGDQASAGRGARGGAERLHQDLGARRRGAAGPGDRRHHLAARGVAAPRRRLPGGGALRAVGRRRRAATADQRAVPAWRRLGRVCGGGRPRPPDAGRNRPACRPGDAAAVRTRCRCPWWSAIRTTRSATAPA